MTVLKDAFASKKFIVLLVGATVWLGRQLGLDIAPAEVDKLLALIGVYILGQGIADHGGGHAQVKRDIEARRKAEGGFTVIGLMFALAIAGTIVMVGACAWLGRRAENVKTAFLDCTSEERAADIRTYGPLVDDIVERAIDPTTRKVAIGTVKEKTKTLLEDKAKCVLFTSLAKALAPARQGFSGPGVDLVALRDDASALVVELVGKGGVVHTSEGDLK